MHNGDGSRPRIRPAVSNRFDNSSYYEYLEKQTANSDQQAQPAQHRQVAQPSQNSQQQPAPHPQNQQQGPSQGQPEPGNQQQPPRRSKTFMWLTGIAILAIIALVVTVGFVLLGPNKGVEPTAPRSAPTTEPNDSASSSHETESPNERAKSELETIVADSEAELSKLEEKWVIQLSAKRPG